MDSRNLATLIGPNILHRVSNHLPPHSIHAFVIQIVVKHFNMMLLNIIPCVYAERHRVCLLE